MTAPSPRIERRAFGPGARHVLLYGLGGLMLAAVLLAGYIELGPVAHSAATAGTAPAVSSAPTSGSNATYGALPSWLPKATVPVGRVVTASAAHPWLAIEGDTVDVRLPHGTAAVTTVGPYNDPSGRFPLPALLRSTFVMTFAHVTGTVPISARDFVVIDEHGFRFDPVVRSSTGGAPPSAITPGAPVSIHLVVNLTEGSGLLRWSPNGKTTVVGWDYTNEYD